MGGIKKKLVILSGAGMSAESGIATFRGGDGLWENHRIEDVATPEAWQRDPVLVQRFYNERRKQVLDAKPNKGHVILAQLQQHFDVWIITQNIDDLHERGGSSQVMHLHGEITKARSVSNAMRVYPIDGWELTFSDLDEWGKPLRPFIVWFGEPVPLLGHAADLCSTADIFVVVGTSLQVYPAAGLIHEVPMAAKCFVIDPTIPDSVGLKRFETIRLGASEGLLLFAQQMIPGFAMEQP
jgi:NAD-dependent deacetylase